MNDQYNLKPLDLIAYCGLNCAECNIYLATSDSEIANKLVEAFQGKWENVKVDDFHCGTCRNVIKDCWTEECWIRDCSHKKKVEYCYECVEFPCSKLKDWSGTNRRYKDALNNLKAMKKQKNKKIN